MRNFSLCALILAAVGCSSPNTWKGTRQMASADPAVVTEIQRLAAPMFAIEQNPHDAGPMVATGRLTRGLSEQNSQLVDAVAVLKASNTDPAAPADESVERRVVIYKRNPNNTLVPDFHLKALSSDEGGMMGDPFQELQVGSTSSRDFGAPVRIKYLGGSRYSWGYDLTIQKTRARQASRFTTTRTPGRRGIVVPEVPGPISYHLMGVETETTDRVEGIEDKYSVNLMEGTFYKYTAIPANRWRAIRIGRRQVRFPEACLDPHSDELQRHLCAYRGGVIYVGRIHHYPANDRGAEAYSEGGIPLPANLESLNQEFYTVCSWGLVSGLNNMRTALTSGEEDLFSAANHATARVDEAMLRGNTQNLYFKSGCTNAEIDVLKNNFANLIRDTRPQLEALRALAGGR